MSETRLKNRRIRGEKKYDMNINIWPGWHIAGKIGSGSFGTVYEIHRGDGAYLEKAAMKVIRIPSDTSELMQLREDGIRAGDTESYLARQVEDIRREIGLMQRFVGFSNIVSYEDYAIHRHAQGIGWDILIRMELLTGLSSYMADHILTEGEVLKLGLDISQALMICHRAGIIHRDIKPQNIFLNSLGFYKLGDFGISRAVPRSGSVMSFKGTVSYMAPETFSMRSTDARSDIYSLALVMYRILNGGREPFLPPSGITPAQREAAQHRRLMGEPLPRPERGSDMLWGVLATALAPDPAARYHTAGQFHAALQKVVGEQGAQSTDGTSSGVQRTGGARGRSIISRIGSILCAGGRISGSRKRAALIASLILASFVLLSAGVFGIMENKRGYVTEQVSVNTLTSAAVEEGVKEEEGDKETILTETEEEKVGSSSGKIQAADGQNVSGYHGQADIVSSEGDFFVSSDREEGYSGLDGQEDRYTDSDEEENTDEETEDTVTFQDEALEQAVLEALGMEGRNITVAEAAACTELRLTGGAKSGAGKISDLTGLSAFSNLEVLYLDQNRISDISELGLIHTLKIVNLEYNYISDLAPVAALSNLEQLELRENTVHDISPVSYCQELKVLDFRDNVVDDISSLQDMISLKQLVMSGNRIESLDPVSDLKDLWYLSFNKNPVNDINPVRNLQNLTTLCMSGTDVEDIGVLFELPVLGYVDISGCDRISKDSVKKLKERKGLRVVE